MKFKVNIKNYTTNQKNAPQNDSIIDTMVTLGI